MVEFVAHLARLRCQPLFIDEWEHQLDGLRKNIDALIAGGPTPIAIEHTSIDTFPKQREDDDHYLQVVADWPAKFKGKVNRSIEITLPCFSFSKGTDRKGEKNALEQWIECVVPDLPDGHGYHDVPGVTAKVLLNIKSDLPPELSVQRPVPKTTGSYKHLIPSLRNRIEKLADSKPQGYETILLVESDCPLMDEDLMARKLSDAIKQINSVLPDQIWYCLTHEREHLFYFYRFEPTTS